MFNIFSILEVELISSSFLRIGRMFCMNTMAMSFFFSSMILSMAKAKTSLKYFLLIFAQTLEQKMMYIFLSKIVLD